MRERLVTWALIVALALGSFTLWRWAGAERTRANGLESDLKTLRIKHRALQTNVQTLEAKRATTRKELTDALRKDPDWARTATPEPVVNVLCKRLKCE